MAVALVALILLQKSALKEAIRAQSEAGSAGLPVTKAQIAAYAPTSATRRSDKFLRSLTASFKYSQLSGVPDPVQNIDWAAAIQKLRPIADQIDPLTVDDPADIMSGFPGHATVKALIKAMIRKAYAPETTDMQRVELLALIRKLFKNQGWNRDLVAHLVGTAMHSVYVKSALDYQKTSPGWFRNHPDLAIAFDAPDFAALLRGEFVQTAYTVCGSYPLNTKTKFAKGFEPKNMSPMFENWTLLYREAKGVQSFGELQLALKAVKPRMKVITLGGEKMDFTYSIDLDLAKLDARAIQRNRDLETLLR